jgi:hypothetical protein
MGDRMDKPGSSGGELGEGTPHQDRGPVGSTSVDQKSAADVPRVHIIFCVFPNIGWITSILDPKKSPLFFYDMAKLPHQDPHWNFPDVPPKNTGEGLFPEEVALGYEEFLAKIEVGNGNAPEDAHRASLIRYYMLARSSAFLIHLDAGVNSPEMMLAHLSGIPIIGISERYIFSPQVMSIVDILVKPRRELIIAAIHGVLSSAS